jgi:hypothetical protein
VIDPFSDDCAVVTGSYNFSGYPSQNNDENLIIIRGNRLLARAYALHVNAVCERYQWKASLANGIAPEMIYPPLDAWKPGGTQEEELDFWMGHVVSTSRSADQFRAMKGARRPSKAATDKKRKTSRISKKATAKKAAKKARPKKATAKKATAKKAKPKKVRFKKATAKKARPKKAKAKKVTPKKASKAKKKAKVKKPRVNG